MEVWLLWHMRPLDDDPDLDPEMVHIDTDDRLCGVFSTEANAEAARDRLRSRPGFRDHPDAFWMGSHLVDDPEPGWPEGFVSLWPS